MHQVWIPVCKATAASTTIIGQAHVHDSACPGCPFTVPVQVTHRHQGYGDTLFIDEVFVKIHGKQHYLWRAVDQDGEVIDVFLQARRDGKAAKRFFKQFLMANRHEPRKIVTDKSGS
jgi:hypothetical protein